MIVIDARCLAPPEPFERLLAELARMPESEQILLILDREPFPLYRFLKQNRYGYQVEWIEAPESRWEVRIWEEA